MYRGNKGAYRWLFVNTKPIFGAIFVLTVLGVLISFISVEFALAARDLLDCATGVSGKNFVSCVVRLAVLLAAEVALESIYNIYAVKISSKNKNRLQKNLFSSVMTGNYTGIGDYHSGELINRLTGDINIINSNIIDVIPAFVMLVTTVVLSFRAMFMLDAQLSFICLALGPVVLVTSALYGRKMKKIHKDCQQSDGKTRSFMQECIQNILVIKAFRNEKKAEEHTALLQNVNYKCNMKRGYISILVNLLYYLAMTAAYYFAVAWCAYKISIGIMTVGTFTAVLQLVNSIQTPFREISGTVSQFFATCASAERIMEVENLPRDGIYQKNITDFEKIEVSDLTFAYGDEEIFSGASLSIEKGDIAVISGDSGKGKSTFFKLLMGILSPGSGRLIVHTKDGSFEADDSTRSLFAYVPQGNMIISGTVGENIAFFSDAGMDEIIKAAKCADIFEYINTLPDGFDTLLGEGGMGLSEGQIQRLAVARALCTSAPIILLDEATSSLDEETEARILENIRSLDGRTIIIITHRKAAFQIAGKVITLENGSFITD